MALLRREPEPLCRLGVVGRNAAAGVIGDAEVELRGRIALIGGETEPADAFALVEGDAVALEVHGAEVELAGRIVLPRGALNHLPASP